MHPATSVQPGCRMHGIGFPVTGASPAGAQVFDRIERDVRRGDIFPGSSCAVQEAQRDRQAVLKELSFVVTADTWNGVGNCIQAEASMITSPWRACRKRRFSNATASTLEKPSSR